MSSSYVAAQVDMAMVGSPVMRRLPRGSRYLYIEALACSRLYLTDGTIPKDALGQMTDEPDPTTAAGQLLLAGLWTDEGDHWQIVGWAESQMTAAQVAIKRSGAKKRYADWQYRDPTTRLPKSKRVSEVPNDTDLTRPDKEGKGRSGAAAPKARASAPDKCTCSLVWKDGQPIGHESRCAKYDG
jgi:hypothetical protein